MRPALTRGTPQSQEELSPLSLLILIILFVIFRFGRNGYFYRAARAWRMGCAFTRRRVLWKRRLVWRRRRLGPVVKPMRKLSAEERNRIEAAVAAAETRTSAEFAVVVAQASDDYAPFPLLWAGLLALLTGGVIAIAAPMMSVGMSFAIQAGVFIAAGLLLQSKEIAASPGAAFTPARICRPAGTAAIRQPRQ